MTLLQRSICCIALFIGIVAAINYLTRKESNSDTLTIGVIIGYEPFAVLSNSGELIGFDIDVAQELGKALGKKIVFQDMSLAALLIALEQNKIAMVMSSLSITKEREDTYTMIHYYGEPTTQFPLVFWNDTPQTLPAIKTMAELAAITTMPIIVEPGSSQEKLVLDSPSILAKPLSTVTDIVLDLKYKKSYAALLDPEIVPTLQRQNKELQSLLIDVPLQYQSKGAGIAVNKNNSALSQQVSAAIKTLQQNGTIRALENKWLKDPS